MKRGATLVGVLGLGLLVMNAHAADNPLNGDIWDIKLGTPVADLSTDRYFDFACGTAGGPPGLKLDSWTAFATCPGEADTGLHEVYFRFDDEAEYVARAHRNVDAIETLAGTKLAGQDVIVSVLVGDTGIVDGMRIVSDDRAGATRRKTANLLGLRLMNRYDPDGWTCIDMPPSQGRTSIGGAYIDRRCEEIFNNDRRLVLQIAQYRRADETGVDREGNYMPGEFANTARLDIYALKQE